MQRLFAMRFPAHRPMLMCLLTLFCATSLQAAEIHLDRNDQGVAIMVGDQLFTQYHTGLGPKPILWPVYGPDQKPVTRAFPMERGEGERFDHPHHRSLWFTHGAVNGIDYWTEGKNHGVIKHREFVTIEEGEEAKIVTVNDWLNADGERAFHDMRTLTFQADEDRRIIDFDITIAAVEEPVVFGDTKEGTFGVRVAGTMRVEQKGDAKRGRIINANGQYNLGAWGKRAPWVDYHGPIDGEIYGIAILNHPSSFRFPTYWHVRTYGLFAANPFGVSDFVRGSDEDGSHTIKPGESITLRYRVLLHRGDEEQGRVAEAFESYAKEP